MQNQFRPAPLLLPVPKRGSSEWEQLSPIATLAPAPQLFQDFALVAARFSGCLPRISRTGLEPESEMTANTIHGGCLCGAVRYEVTGEPYNVTHCHCTDCRRCSGAAFVTWASFRRSEFRFTEGEPRVVSWAGRLRSFCGACGTPLTFITAPQAEEIDVTVCSFDHPDKVSPAGHTWVDDRLPWIQLTDELPKYRQAGPTHSASP